MANVAPRINLLKDKQVSFLDKFINWTLTVGRLVVILTELVVLSAFIYRFFLDRSIIDLHAKIKQEQAIVNYLKGSEAIYRNLQDRISLSSKFSTMGTLTLKTFNDVLNFAPKDMTIVTFYLNKDRINISANVQSTSSLNQFMNALKNYSATKTVSLDNIENKPASAIVTFNTTVTLK